MIPITFTNENFWIFFFWKTETYCRKVALRRTVRLWLCFQAPTDPCGRYRTPIVRVTHTFDFSSQLMEAGFKYFTIVYVVTDCSTIPARHFVTVVRLMHSTQCRNTSLSSLLNKYLQNNDGLFFLDFVVTVAISPMFLIFVSVCKWVFLLMRPREY